MGTTSITLTLIVVAIAIGVTAWTVISRRGKSRERHPERKRRQEPRQPEPTTADESLVQSKESHAPVAEDEAIAPADETSTVAATEPTPQPEGDARLAINEDLPVQVQAGTPEASVESPDSSNEARTVNPETPSKSDPQESASAQQLEKPAEQPCTDGEVTPALVEGAEEVGEPIEPDVVVPPEKAARKPQRKERRAPEDRGGRSRVSTPSGDIEREQKPKPRAPKPEIVCWKREREWILAMELPDDLSEKTGVTVVQGGKPLAEDRSEKGCWRLVQLQGEVTVRTLEAETESLFKIALGDDDWLVFKLSGGDLSQGRRVKRAAYGSCLAVVPDSWERDEEKAGTAPATPEPVCLDGYQTHFFDLVGNTTVSIAFRDNNGRAVVNGSGEARVQLVGHELPDASENLGPLFGVSPPCMRIAHGSWEDVGIIVLGEEGSGRGRWRKSWKPKDGDVEQELTADITRRKSGWYFVRLYDLQDELIDSLDFRFVAGLRGLAVQQSHPFPSATGHAAATVEFLHDADCCVRAASASPMNVRLDRAGEKTVLTIPSEAVCDRTHWLVGPPDGPQVEVVLLIQRVWWAVGKVSEPPSQWNDVCLSLYPEYFSATSDKAIWLRFPSARWVMGVTAGFQQAMRRTYAVKATDSAVAIPLRDFSDSQELADRTKACFLKIWARVDGSLYEVEIVTIPADAPEGTLNIARLSACRLARVLTALSAATHGPLHQVVKEVRRRYRRPRRAPLDGNAVFVQDALCVIALVLQQAESRQFAIPKSAARWRSRARLANRKFPEAARQLWSRYRALKK